MSPVPPARAARVRVRHPAAELLPVARVALLTPVPHLDRVFDYEVPEKLAAAAQPGVRVRVRLAGRLVDGFVLERVETSERELQPLSSVHGPAVLTPRSPTCAGRWPTATRERSPTSCASPSRPGTPAWRPGHAVRP